MRTPPLDGTIVGVHEQRGLRELHLLQKAATTVLPWVLKGALVVTSPYDPPRAPIDEGSRASTNAAPTVGFLVGGLLQLGIGAFLIVRSVLGEPPDASILGLLLAFLGIRALLKYRARTRGSRRV